MGKGLFRSLLPFSFENSKEELEGWRINGEGKKLTVVRNRSLEMDLEEVVKNENWKFRI